MNETVVVFYEIGSNGYCQLKKAVNIGVQDSDNQQYERINSEMALFWGKSMVFCMHNKEDCVRVTIEKDCPTLLTLRDYYKFLFPLSTLSR
jgi:hypothetical protein